MLEAGMNAFSGLAYDERGFALVLAATRLDALLARA